MDPWHGYVAPPAETVTITEGVPKLVIGNYVAAAGATHAVGRMEARSEAVG